MTRTLWPDPLTLDISQHQRDALAAAFSSRLGILTGKPGVGKTHSVAELIRSIVSRYGQSAVNICAPTGKAAQRLNQILKEKGLRVTCSTIHRLLGVSKSGRDGNGWGFMHGPANPLERKFLIVSEGSMIDTDLMNSLLSAVLPTTHVLIEGDIGQLTPVGHGAPMRDMLAAGVPHGELSEIWRNSGTIVKACSDIREGKTWQPASTIREREGMNLLHIESTRSTATIQTLKRLISTVPTELDRIWDVQVLVTVNAKSDLSRKALNLILQDLLNPTGQQQDGGGRFRVGDKIICTQNTMLELVEENGEPIDVKGTEDFIANGEIGRIREFDGKTMLVEFPEPPRVVKVPLGKPKKQPATTKGKAKAESEDEDDNNTGCQFDLGFALTFHRSQGSQWPVVIIIGDDYPGAKMVACRELLYTGISRAQRICLTIGRKSTLDGWCKRVALSGRKTFLAELLREQIGSHP